jgi:hypothetical protein
MGAIWELFSQGFDDLLGRAGGPLRFRLVVMPTVVVFLAIRAHLKVVRAGKSADTISYLAREGLKQRLEDVGFARRYEALDQAMIGNPCC